MKPSHATNDHLIDLACEVWQPRASRDITDEDVRQITDNAISFFSIFAEWSRTPAVGAGSPVASDNEETLHDR
jgi:hypothetical protein